MDQKEWPFDFGTLKLEHVYETVGAPFLQPAKSRLTLQPKDGQRIVLFEGQPIFQEKYPIVNDIAIDGQVLTFTDGVRSYSLRIEKPSPRSAPAAP